MTDKQLFFGYLFLAFVWISNIYIFGIETIVGVCKFYLKNPLGIMILSVTVASVLFVYFFILRPTPYQIYLKKRRSILN